MLLINNIFEIIYGQKGEGDLRNGYDFQQLYERGKITKMKKNQVGKYNLR